MTFDKKLNSVDTCAKENTLYFRAQTPAYLFWIETRNNSRSKSWNSFICSRKAASLSWNLCTNLKPQPKILRPIDYLIQKYTRNMTRSKCIGTQSMQEIVSKYDVLQVMLVYMFSTCSLTVQKMGSKHDSHLTSWRRIWRSICDKWELKTWLAACDKIPVL